MGHNTFTRGMIVAVFVVLQMKISYMDITGIPGQTRPDDPHACFWFTRLNGSSIFRCCDGYFKIDATNLTMDCIECSSGWYGFFCQNKCTHTCENGGTCNSVDGSCRCSEQYFGNNCQNPCHCQNGATCMYDGRCLCANGFYGELCQKKCSCPEHSECNSETEECFCQEGFYGDSGTCSCKPGYYGENCEKQCSCFNGAYCGNDHYEHCKCSPGYNGSECTDCDSGLLKSNGLSFCEDKCLHCYNGHVCTVDNGDCLCSPGWQGNRCDQKCESGFYGNNCSEVCQCQNGMCDHVAGICQCESGWTGQHCEQPCPDNCFACKGDVCISCKPGWTGEHCENPCPNNCLVCEDDICTSCKPGWTGESCVIRCKLGFHGDSCHEQCSECNCTTSCHHINGTCPYIVRCEEHNCKYLNAKMCLEDPFKLECRDGWTGRLCDVKTSMTTAKDYLKLSSKSSTPREAESPTHIDDDSTSKTLIFILVLIVIVSVLINIAVIIAAYYYVKRHTKPRNRSHDIDEIGEVEMDDHRPDGNTHQYENIPGPTETTINSEEYQRLCDFTYSQYQKLDTTGIRRFST